MDNGQNRPYALKVTPQSHVPAPASTSLLYSPLPVHQHMVSHRRSNFAPSPTLDLLDSSPD
ncbi:hypothetical protein HO173_012796 [Letharia columbiana]|uniref:Uncharacterized protein n=1 Tax=Letharia columbiana TaxID=112416 RepID=A0A8H6CKR5_9LECA|nr:uncharacterized protein HO173_012796 [Letharia columbiana]KAF6225358.1 hypothetical protein HO173_012796 [Letharia columbiana]